jgi:hypothetical protein
MLDVNIFDADFLDVQFGAQLNNGRFIRQAMNIQPAQMILVQFCFQKVGGKIGDGFTFYRIKTMVVFV